MRRASVILAICVVAAAAAATASPAKLPPASTLCSWINPTYIARSHCGHPSTAGACTFTSPVTLSGTTLAAGRFTCDGAPCTRHRQAQPGAFWLGGHPGAEWFTCANKIRAGFYVALVRLVSPGGGACQPVRPPIPQMGSFHIPATWGGHLQVVWNISTWRDNIPAGYALESADFALHGKENGCSLLETDGTPVG